jgi:hypothetical protein
MRGYSFFGEPSQTYPVGSSPKEFEKTPLLQMDMYETCVDVKDSTETLKTGDLLVCSPRTFKKSDASSIVSFFAHGMLGT